MAPRLLFVSLTNDVGSDRIVSELGRQGAVCGVLGSAGCFAGLSRFVTERFALPSAMGSWGGLIGLRGRLDSVLQACQPDRIVPLDELAALTLRSIGRRCSMPSPLRLLITRSLGRLDNDAACHRLPLMQLADRLGLRVPRWSDAADAQRFADFPVIAKRDGSSGSGGVAVAANPAELAQAVRQLRRRQSAKSMLATLAGHRAKPAPILVQQFIEGRLAMFTVACEQGRVLDGIGFEAVATHPTKRSSTQLRPIANLEMAETSGALVGALGCSGFVSFDFIVDSENRAWLIEMNPRPIGSTHLGRLFGRDLCCSYLSQSMSFCQPVLSPDRAVALFPKELERDPASDCLASHSALYHDVPRDEPAIVEAYLQHLGTVHAAALDTVRVRLGVAEPARPNPEWRFAGQPAPEV